MTTPVTDWRQAFREADELPSTATSKEKASRGRQLERILAAMFKDAGLAPRLSFRPQGEEVDGSIWLHGRTILIEAKWTDGSHPASSLYQFKGKVDGKLDGTLGLFISIGGFSPDSVDALVAGKGLNLILADGDDMREIVGSKMTIVEALELKLRAAGDAGTPFLSLTAATTSTPAATGQHLIMVEGPSDVRYLESILRVQGVESRVKFVPASGPMNMIPVTRLMLEIAESVTAVTIVVDGDIEGPRIDRLRDELDRLVSEFGMDRTAVEIIVAQPELEVMLGLAESGTRWSDRRHLRRISEHALDALITEADVLRRAAKDPTLANLLRAIGIENT